MLELHNIEDCLEVFAGMRKDSPKFAINGEDCTIMYSIARQVFKGTALTDRQYVLMQEKLLKYKPQFESNGFNNLEEAITVLRNPLRSIDRSKYVKLVNGVDAGFQGSQETFIKVRFPFKKTDILLIQEIPSGDEGYFHEKGSHEHFFTLTEQHVYEIIKRFSNKDFIIDQALIEIYNQILEIKEQKEKYVCGIFNDQLVNLHPKAAAIALEELGEFNSKSKLLYVDRRRRYGIAHVDESRQYLLKEKIAYRETAQYLSKPSDESLSEVLKVLWDLNRFPLIVLLDKVRAEEQLHEFVTYYRDILPPEEQSVLFRLDGDSGFNQLVKDRKLNNWVDKNTKIVYISSDKLPKVIVNNEWRPIAALGFTSKLDRTVDSYIANRCDLIVFREEMLSPLRKFSRYYG